VIGGVSLFIWRRRREMDVLIEAAKALEKAKRELFEYDMALTWELKIGYINSALVKSTYPPPRPECIAQSDGSEK
jgi:hypothetical protein